MPERINYEKLPQQNTPFFIPEKLRKNGFIKHVKQWKYDNNKQKNHGAIVQCDHMSFKYFQD